MLDGKISRILLFVILGVLAAQMLFMVFGMNRNLNNALSKLKESQDNLDQAMTKITESKSKIDSVQKELLAFGKYIQDIQGRAQILDLERRLNDQKFSAKRDSIKLKLKSLYKDFQIQADSLPATMEITDL